MSERWTEVDVTADGVGVTLYEEDPEADRANVVDETFLTNAECATEEDLKITLGDPDD